MPEKFENADRNKEALSDVSYINHRFELIYADDLLNEKLWWHDSK